MPPKRAPAEGHFVLGVVALVHAEPVVQRGLAELDEQPGVRAVGGQPLLAEAVGAGVVLGAAGGALLEGVRHRRSKEGAEDRDDAGEYCVHGAPCKQTGPTRGAR
ncbi:hypothetical protein GCM10009664_05280 [Kitasatospora gansuensis]